jgi:hypothetical protein
MAIVQEARRRFEVLLEPLRGGSRLTPAVYQRYLSMEYHLTKDVQRYFITVAAHASLRAMRTLRQFLLDFANEEELHYLVAANDLRKMGLDVLPMPFDAELWHAYFSRIIVDRPFVRLGAAMVLENMASDNNRALLKEVLAQPFLNRENTKFLVLHMHETLPHGQQIVDAIAAQPLSSAQLDDLVEGARKGAVLYLRLTKWALGADDLASLADSQASPGMSDEERLRADAFRMEELALG